MGIESFILFLFLSLVHASNDCPASRCQGNTVTIRSPFWLQDRQPQNCGSPGFNLTCPGNNKTSLHIPNNGEFYVSSIYYSIKLVSLYDPHNCLPGRLLTLNLSSSPFKATNYQNYTFLSCPKGQLAYEYIVDCLGNSTTDILAINYHTSVVRFPMCEKIVTLPIPVSSFADYDYIFPKQLELAWDLPTCENCGSDRKGETTSGGHASIIMALSIMIPILVVLIVGTSCCIWVRSNNRTSNQASSTTALSNARPRGLDEFTIDTYRKITISESRCITGPNDATTCSICLEDYKPKQTIRFMPECEHCFHVECIDKWLSMNSMCPICRTLQPRFDS